MTSQTNSTKDTGLIYVYDALCGWCYGFSPVMQAFAETHPDISVTVISGGMITGDRIGPIGEVAPYIKNAYQQVESMTGVEFGSRFLEGILETGTDIFTSIPPAKALAVARAHAPDRQLSFASAMQKAIYFDGMPPSSEEGYGDIAEQLGIERQAFMQEMSSERTDQMIRDEFSSVSSWGITGFPTVILRVGEKMGIITRGFVSLPQLTQQFDQGILQLSA